MKQVEGGFPYTQLTILSPCVKITGNGNRNHFEKLSVTAHFQLMESITKDENQRALDHM